MSELLRKTRSVCPVCLQNIQAQIVRCPDGVYMDKTCPAHGAFHTIVWRDGVDFEEWRAGVPELAEGEGVNCPAGCGSCGQHGQGSCCVLLEVTRRCNLHCTYCFANGAAPEPTLSELKRAVDTITADVKPLLQLSGGEPTLRDDLPELIAHVREMGCRYIQLNTNGIRLAEDEGYLKALASAGLNIIFLQFDGVDDTTYLRLRGQPLLEAKIKAIEQCGKHGLGVTLVPTIVRGVNDGQIGALVRFGMSRSPVVRGVHFQPLSYFGRYRRPTSENAERYTLDELISDLKAQTGISVNNIAPSHCDHPACGFHGSFMVFEDGDFMPLTLRNKKAGRSCAKENMEYIGSRWTRDAEAERANVRVGCCRDSMELDDFPAMVRRRGFTVTAMAFQDAMNFDVERLRLCSLHVYDAGRLKPFCAKYLTAREQS